MSKKARRIQLQPTSAEEASVTEAFAGLLGRLRKLSLDAQLTEQLARQVIGNRACWLVNLPYALLRLDEPEAESSGGFSKVPADDREVASSSTGSGLTKSYVYDSSGNINRERQHDLQHDIASVSGVQNGASVFQVKYDAAGRMISRTTPGQNLQFSYNGFGDVASIMDVATKETTQILADVQGHALQRIQSDGSQEISINSSYTIIIDPTGKRSLRYGLFNEQQLLALAAVSGIASVFANSGYDADDFPEEDSMNTNESKSLHAKSGFLDFRARWYDPPVGRFATPGNITDLVLLFCPDGMNRHAFENNDPINHIDPTGHWSWSAILGVVTGAAMILGGIALTAVTGGAAAVASAALICGGLSGVTCSIDHANENGVGKFWAGFGITVGINAAVTEGLSANVWGSAGSHFAKGFGERLLTAGGD
ncbi:Fc.00g058150.m01.CDS01 [Cosmosporella sp. VM-42]